MRFALAAILTLCTSTAFAGPRVVADIPAVHSITAQVMEGVAAPDLLMPPGASPHDHAMRPSEAEALQAADLVVWIGPDLTPWLERAVANMAGGASSLALLEQPGTLKLETREAALFEAHDHHDDHKHDHDHGHEHGDHDAHAWLDPQNAIVWAGLIAERLSEIDPENAATYRANRDRAVAGLEALQAEIAEQLQPHKDATWVVFHDAYQYFENRFGLATRGAIAVSEASKPSAARVAEIRDFVRSEGVACVFAEPQFGSAMITAVTEGTDTRSGFLDPVGIKIDPGPALYGHLLRRMATDLAACLR